MTNLLPYNTFGISALASQFVEVNSVSQLHNLIQEKKLSEIPFLILGGGSNVLFTKDYAGLVLKNNLKALRFFQSNGFIQEGINRSYSLDDNIPIDAIILKSAFSLFFSS